MKWYGKHGRKVSWNVKRFGKHGRKASPIVIRYEKYGRNPSWIVIRYRQYRRKGKWNSEKIWTIWKKMQVEEWIDMKNMVETQVE